MTYHFSFQVKAQQKAVELIDKYNSSIALIIAKEIIDISPDDMTFQDFWQEVIIYIEKQQQ